MNSPGIQISNSRLLIFYPDNGLCYVWWQVKAPVIVVGCMLDKRDDQQAINLEQVMLPIMQQFREIETCIECSAYKLIQVNCNFIDFSVVSLA